MRFPPVLAAVALFALPSSLDAQTITWGNTPGDLLINSSDEKLTTDWQFELGVFARGFFPTEDNIAEWVENWVPLDRADYNEEIGYFSSRAPALAPEAAGLQAYIWIYNERKYKPDSEWLLITDRDGNHSNDWMIPNPSADASAAIIDWRVARATSVLMGHAPRRTAKVSPAGEAKALAGKTFSTRPVPAAAIVAANRKAEETAAEAAALAGEVAEEFVDE